MSRTEWERAYQVAWDTYYTRDHMQTVLRRIAAMRGKVSNAVFLLTWFKGSIAIEGIHPLEGGFLRLKFRDDRRPGLPRVPAWKFYPRYLLETARKLAAFSSLFLDLHAMYRAIRRVNKGLGYTDLALTPPTDEDLETLELFHTPEAERYVARQRETQGPVHVGAV
jgi:hypothetical protein